MLAAPLQWHV